MEAFVWSFDEIFCCTANFYYNSARKLVSRRDHAIQTSNQASKTKIVTIATTASFIAVTRPV